MLKMINKEFKVKEDYYQKATETPEEAMERAFDECCEDIEDFCRFSYETFKLKSHSVAMPAVRTSGFVSTIWEVE